MREAQFVSICQLSVDTPGCQRNLKIPKGQKEIVKLEDIRHHSQQNETKTNIEPTTLH